MKSKLARERDFCRYLVELCVCFCPVRCPPSLSVSRRSVIFQNFAYIQFFVLFYDPPEKRVSFSRMKNIIIKNYSLWLVFLLLLMMYSRWIYSVEIFLRPVTLETVNDDAAILSIAKAETFYSPPERTSKRSSKRDLSASTLDQLSAYFAERYLMRRVYT